ncbi:3-isopropylmalate dehydratase small subunit [Gordonia sp. KTR9]|uniref:3-isopropylmalate dehydratase small subunit n=1 Tax=Gordonia sp. KTR9 TaxID=337191 RepID=UPI00027DE658|nr:3-isopropylmalate dehydratase small subunit [Gordonia sp. KTR9]AFR49805.1 3-isopropylmalate dehydratase small subunit [Gordonia sp. KTR9]
MREFSTHSGTGVPLRISDIDTDQIIPARFCGGVSKDGLGEALFADWRTDPAFVLNQGRYSGATILVAGENFGCGSSREWAVWALQEYGFRVVIAPRYGDIFRGNSLKNGLLTVEMPTEYVERMLASLDADSDAPITVDLVERTIAFRDRVDVFDLDPDTRWRLLNGKDDIGLTERHTDEITAYEQRRRPCRPSLKAETTR